MDIRELRQLCQASKLIGRPRHPLYRLHRKYSIYLTKLLAATPLTANQVSVVMIGLAALGLSLIAAGHFESGLLMVIFSFVLDKCDGEMARLRRDTSAVGVYLDEIYHTAVPSGLFVAIGVRDWMTRNLTFDVALGLAIGYLVLICRQEHKAAYSVLLKTWPDGARQARTASTITAELKYWVAVPTQDDLVLVAAAASYLLDELRSFLYLYLAVYFVLAILGPASALRGDLGARLQALNPGDKEL